MRKFLLWMFVDSLISWRQTSRRGSAGADL